MNTTTYSPVRISGYLAWTPAFQAKINKTLYDIRALQTVPSPALLGDRSTHRRLFRWIGDDGARAGNLDLGHGDSGYRTHHTAAPSIPTARAARADDRVDRRLARAELSSGSGRRPAVVSQRCGGESDHPRNHRGRQLQRARVTVQQCHRHLRRRSWTPRHVSASL